MPTTTQSMDRIVDITVLVSPQAPSQPTFDQGLIVGPSGRISSVTRLKKYFSQLEMIADGFQATDPEYIAAGIYFGANPPPNILWVGTQDTTAGETILQAITACRQKSTQWWGCVAIGATASDHKNIAAFAQSAEPRMFYFFATQDSDVLAGTPNNVLDALKQLGYNRALGFYSTAQGGSFPNNVYMAAAVMGYTMGANSGLANSFYTLWGKTLPGVATEPLDPTQVATTEGYNGNLYLSYADSYNLTEPGKVPSGQFFDEILNLDMLTSSIQFSVMNVLTQNPAVPMTDPGQTLLMHAVNEACEAARIRGFIAPGTWKGLDLMKLHTGDPIPNGYLTQSPPYAQQTSADRQARKAMPIYTSIFEAQAAQSVSIGVFVQR